jgi:hypothetical protein
VSTVADELRALEEIASVARTLAMQSDTQDRIATLWTNAFIPRSGEAQARAFQDCLQKVVGDGSDQANSALLARATALLDAYKLGVAADPQRVATIPLLAEMLRKAKRRAHMAMWIVLAATAAIAISIPTAIVGSSSCDRSRGRNFLAQVSGAYHDGSRTLVVSPGGVQVDGTASLSVDSWDSTDEHTAKFRSLIRGDALSNVYCSVTVSLANGKLVTAVTGHADCAPFNGTWDKDVTSSTPAIAHQPPPKVAPSMRPSATAAATDEAPAPAAPSPNDVEPPTRSALLPVPVSARQAVGGAYGMLTIKVDAGSCDETATMQELREGAGQAWMVFEPNKANASTGTYRALREFRMGSKVVFTPDDKGAYSFRDFGGKEATLVFRPEGWSSDQEMTTRVRLFDDKLLIPKFGWCDEKLVARLMRLHAGR